MDIRLITSKYYSMPGVADPIEKEKFMEDLEKVTHDVAEILDAHRTYDSVDELNAVFLTVFNMIQA